jgi:hypothetical protein
MAFAEGPEVDDNAMRSEESVNAVRSILTRRNGFVSREETPDYGVDLDVELVENLIATSHKFPVQIKSAKRVKTIKREGKEYITLVFETSRLGYLCKRIPAYGIITLYDEQSGNTYFDYVDEIVRRLDEDKVEWKKQTSVTLRLPNQLLNKENAKDIHSKMSARFKSQQLLIFAQGANYDIPVFNLEQINQAEAKIDFNNTSEIKAFLEEYGLLLLNSDSVDMLLQAIEKLPLSLINSSHKLIVLSALTYGRAGYVIETEGYLRRAFNLINTLSEEEKELLESTKIRVAYFKGEIDERDFIKQLDALLKKSTNEVNSINFRINIVYLKLIETIGNDVIDYAIAEQIDHLYALIESASISEDNKALLTIFNCENLQIFADQVFTRDAIEVKILEELGMLPPLEWRVDKVRFLLYLMERATSPAIAIFKKYRDSGNERIIGYSLSSIARAFQITQFTQMTLHAGEKRVLFDGQDKLYLENEKAALSASQHFFACKLYKEAHQALGIAYEIKLMGELCFGLKSEIATIVDIKNNLSYIEQLTGIKPYTPISEEVYHSISTARETSKKPLGELSKDEVLALAKLFAKTNKLPENRLENIISDINNHQVFSSHTKSTDYELINNQNKDSLGSVGEAYKEPASYQIRNKKTQWVSVASGDIYYLMEQVFGK